MNTARRIALLVLVAGTSVSQKPWSFANNVGVAVVPASGKACLSIRDAAIPAGSRIRLVFPSRPQVVFDARIVRTDESCSHGDADLHSYEIRMEGGNIETPAVAIAISGYAGAFLKQGDLVTASLSRDKRRESFWSCATTEGLHFTVWSGTPLKGTLRWHQYYYLGYDVDPTCTPAEVASPK